MPGSTTLAALTRALLLLGMANRSIKWVDDSNALTELKNAGSKLVIITFTADWCGPCRMVTSVLEELAQEYTDVSVFQINTDENPKMPSQYGIRSIPTTLLFRNAEVIETVVGAVPKTTIASLIEKYIE